MRLWEEAMAGHCKIGRRENEMRLKEEEGERKNYLNFVF